jgi:hypothetical protein
VFICLSLVSFLNQCLLYLKYLEGVSAEGFELPTEGYGLPAEGYGVPIEGYTVPTEGYSVPAEGNGLPTGFYPLPTEGYEVPSETYAVPPGVYEVPSETYAAPPGVYEVPPETYAVPPGVYDVPSETFMGYSVPAEAYEVPTEISQDTSPPVNNDINISIPDLSPNLQQSPHYAYHHPYSVHENPQAGHSTTGTTGSYTHAASPQFNYVDWTSFSGKLSSRRWLYIVGAIIVIILVWSFIFRYLHNSSKKLQ